MIVNQMKKLIVQLKKTIQKQVAPYIDEPTNKIEFIKVVIPPKDQRTKGPKNKRTKGPKDQRTKGELPEFNRVNNSIKLFKEILRSMNFIG